MSKITRDIIRDDPHEKISSKKVMGLVAAIVAIAMSICSMFPAFIVSEGIVGILFSFAAAMLGASLLRGRNHHHHRPNHNIQHQRPRPTRPMEQNSGYYGYVKDDPPQDELPSDGTGA